MAGAGKLFKMDNDLEKKGIEIEYEELKVLIARSGGGNHQYKKRLSALSKPFQRSIQNGILSDEKAMELMTK